MHPELEALVARGLTRLRALGFSASGFVPPAWLMRADARPGIYAAGVAFTEDDGAIYLADGHRIATPALRWSTRTALRAGASSGRGMALGSQRRTPVMRIALHPADLSHPGVARSVERALSRWTAVRVSRTYASLAA